MRIPTLAGFYVQFSVFISFLTVVFFLDSSMANAQCQKKCLKAGYYKDLVTLTSPEACKLDEQCSKSVAFIEGPKKWKKDKSKASFESEVMNNFPEPAFKSELSFDHKAFDEYKECLAHRVDDSTNKKIIEYIIQSEDNYRKYGSYEEFKKYLNLVSACAARKISESLQENPNRRVYAWLGPEIGKSNPWVAAAAFIGTPELWRKVDRVFLGKNTTDGLEIESNDIVILFFDDMAYSGSQLTRDVEDMLKLFKERKAKSAKALLVLPYFTRQSESKLRERLNEQMIDIDDENGFVCMTEYGTRIPEIQANKNTTDANASVHVNLNRTGAFHNDFLDTFNKAIDSVFSKEVRECELRQCGRQAIWLDHKLADWVSIKTWLIAGYLPDCPNLKGYDKNKDPCEKQRIPFFKSSNIDPWHDVDSKVSKSMFYPAEPYNDRLSKPD